MSVLSGTSGNESIHFLLLENILVHVEVEIS